MSSRTRNRMSAGSGGSSGKGPEAAGSLVASGVVRQIDQPQVTKSRELERWQGRKALWAHHRTQRTQHPAQQLELNAGPTGSSHARPPNRLPRTGQAAPGRPGSGGAGRGWEWRRPQPAAEPGPGGGGRWSSPEVGVPRAAVDGGRGHACGRALGGAAHTSPRRHRAAAPRGSIS